jgi:hypothetical protein
MAEDITKKLQKYFNLGSKKTKVKTSNKKDNLPDVFPIEHSPTEKRPDRYTKVQFPSDLEKFYNYWINQCHDNPETLKNRFDRYNDLNYMAENNTIISRSAQLYADETTQADSQSRIIVVEAKNKKLQKELYELLDKWGFNPQRLNDIAYNLALYGDSFDVNAIDNKEGITEVMPIDVITVKSKLEFDPIEVEKKMINNQGFKNYTGAYKSIDKVVKNLTNSADYTKYFRTYLFGYQISDTIFLPPWGISHYRMFTKQSEFYPYGRSLFINCISPFRQLKAFENLQAMARASQFPKETYEVKVSDNMTQADIWNAVNEAREEYLNLNQTLANKEDFALGSQLWMPEGLLNMKLVENKMTPDDLGDLEYFQKALATGTGVPMSFLSPDDGNFGTTGISLLQQYKPFARSIFKIQSAILNEINLKFQIHNVITEKYKPEEFEFNLYMNFPSVEMTRDKMSSKSDSIRLANDILTNLGQSLGLDRGEALPTAIVKDVFSNYSFLEFDEVEKWIKDYEKQKEAENKSLDMQEKTKQKVKHRLSEGLIRELYFDAFRTLNLKEGVLGQNHFMNSNGLEKYQKDLIMMIKEEKDLRIQEQRKKKKLKK